jgi:ElaA protein
MIIWDWRDYDHLSTEQLYDILADREAVFIVEQRCPFQDADGIPHIAMLRNSGMR